MGWVLLGVCLVCIIAFLYNFIRFICKKNRRKRSLVLITASVVIAASILLYCSSVIRAFEATYPSSKTIFAATDTIMVIVPHPDDDLLLAAQVMAFAVRDGATVKLVMATSGDAFGLGEVRLKETLNTAAMLGIPQENVILMGYPEDVLYQLYYAEDYNEVFKVKNGADKTAGLTEHPYYHSQIYGRGGLFTRAVFLQDLTDIILENRPTHIFAIDWDRHNEHRVLGMFTDEVLGNILRSGNVVYTPDHVYKGFAYNTGFWGPSDLWENIELLPTFAPKKAAYETDNPYYAWNDRVRFPVPRDMLYPDVARNRAAQVFRNYMSQWPMGFIPQFINSDKPYWERSVNSITYTAKITASSGNASVLNDFRLGDALGLLNNTSVGGGPLGDNEALRNVALQNAARLKAGMWMPDADDPEKSFTITLDKPQKLAAVWLYLNPKPDGAITEAKLTLDDMEILLDETCFRNAVVKIDLGGAVSGALSFQILAGEAECGVAEIEIYSEKPVSKVGFVKITDTATDPANFAYALFMQKGAQRNLKLYAPFAFAKDDVAWNVAPANKGLAIKDGVLIADANASGRYTVTAQLGDLSDETGVLIVSASDLSIYKCWQKLLNLTRAYYYFQYRLYMRNLPTSGNNNV